MSKTHTKVKLLISCRDWEEAVLFLDDYIFYWSIVALYCHVSFFCTAKWVSYTYTYAPYFLDFLPILLTTDHWVEFSVLYSRFSLAIYFVHSINSVCRSIPISQFIPHLPFSLWYPYVCFLHLCLYFCFANKFILWLHFKRMDSWERHTWVVKLAIDF